MSNKFINRWQHGHSNLWFLAAVVRKWTCARINRVSVQRRMLVGTQNHANLANSQKGGGGTDFSIAAIMARGPSSREPSERSSSKCKIVNAMKLLKNNTNPWIGLIAKPTVMKLIKFFGKGQKCSAHYSNEILEWAQSASMKPSIFMVPMVLCVALH